MPRLAFTLDARSPAIVVPLTGSDVAELEQQVAALTGEPVDVVEWRVDRFDWSGEPGIAVAALRRLGELLPRTPLLVTFRTVAEGGDAVLAEEAYPELVEALCASDVADAVDVEFQHPRATEAMEVARRHRVAVVASNHDFDRTPPEHEIVERLEQMETAGADVAKIAVMPRSAADVLVLLSATERRSRDAGVPLVTMAMGPLGAVSRLGGCSFGSAATFATVGAASAPGQLPARGVRAALDVLLSATPG